VNEHYSHAVETENSKPFNTLTERLDPSIGEVSTVMGAMMTELLRRALRGSVRQIDEELQGEVDQKLDATIAQRLPAIEQSAAEAADKVARQAATEVAVEEVHALGERTRESERQMLARLQTTAQAAEQQTAETARALTSKIELVEKNAEQAVTSSSHELTSRIEEAAKSVTTLAEEKARALARDIEEAERRANEAAKAEATRQVEDVLNKARITAAGIKERLQGLETMADTLHKGLQGETGDRKTEHGALRALVDGRLSELLRQLEEHKETRRTSEEQLRRELTEARQRNEALAARVLQLESPRGVRALWGRLFGRRKAEPGVKGSVDADENDVDDAPAV
jgi:hypothetical protein